MDVVDEVVDEVDVEEDEGSSMARCTELILRDLTSIESDPPVFRLKSVYHSVSRALRGVLIVIF